MLLKCHKKVFEKAFTLEAGHPISTRCSVEETTSGDADLCNVHDSSIHDIHDGCVYQIHKQKGFIQMFAGDVEILDTSSRTSITTLPGKDRNKNDKPTLTITQIWSE